MPVTIHELAVPVVKGVLRGAGLPEEIIRGNRLDETALVGGVVPEIEVETAFSPPVRIDVKRAMARVLAPGPPSPVLSLLKPKVRLATFVGPRVIAPYGEPGGAWKRNLALLGVGVLSVVGTAFWAAFRLGRRRGEGGRGKGLGEPSARVAARRDVRWGR